jgi:hypothetical protein
MLRNGMRVDWIHLAQDRGQLWHVVNTLINLWFSQLDDCYILENYIPPWS